MKWVRAIFKWLLVIFLGFLIGVEFSQFLNWNQKVAVFSNRSAVETDLVQGIEDYHKANGRFPDSLDSIKISWLQNEDERRKMLLKPFYYENRGSTYVLWWPRSEL